MPGGEALKSGARFSPVKEPDRMLSKWCENFVGRMETPPRALPARDVRGAPERALTPPGASVRRHLAADRDATQPHATPT
jgi:hypothetical protein